MLTSRQNRGSEFFAVAQSSAQPEASESNQRLGQPNPGSKEEVKLLLTVKSYQIPKACFSFKYSASLPPQRYENLHQHIYYSQLCVDGTRDLPDLRPCNNKTNKKQPAVTTQQRRQHPERRSASGDASRNPKEKKKEKVGKKRQLPLLGSQTDVHRRNKK